MTNTLPIYPRLSEKVHDLSKTAHVFVFDVPASANKQIVAEQIKKQFDVDVKSVRIAVIKGKSKRTVAQKGKRVLRGRQSTIKKAYVTLQEGSHLAFFEEIENEENKKKESGEKIVKAMKEQDEKAAAKSGHKLRRRKKAEVK